MIKKLYLYLILVAVACVGTALFMVCHPDLYSGYGIWPCCEAVWHSLPQHLTVAGYVMALPFLLELVRIWMPPAQYSARRLGWHTRFMQCYMPAVVAVLFIGWMANVVLYGYWGIVLDDTALFYLLDNPFDALAEAPFGILLLALLAVSLLVWGVAVGMKWMFFSKRPYFSAFPERVLNTVLILLLCGLDFLAIRGGWTASTMNPGRAYFSSEMPLNHAAVDPVFNFLYSLGKDERFDRQYRFMTDEEAQAALSELQTATVALPSDSLQADTLLCTRRPNILLILFESFSGNACQYITPAADRGWMPTVNQAMEQGVAFTRFYANSFRTDRGMAAVMASYPGQPTNSVMKDQSKCDNLQYLSKRLGQEGYRLQFIHGGDVNFTNMKGFLRAGGITDIVADQDFPIGERLDKWGVRDDRMFAYVADRVIADATSPASADAPFFKAFLTVSSHEPFEVPYHHYNDIYLNSVAYADSCFGAMLQTLQSRPEVWQNLLIIGLADHCYSRFPSDMQQHDPRRYHIPMFWTGGAVSRHRDVSVLGQQTDLAATLLGQLGISHDEFTFSKDMLDPKVGHYAFYAFSDGFGLLTDSCQYVQDNKNDGVGLQPGTDDPEGRAVRWGKAYLQKLYDDLSGR